MKTVVIFKSRTGFTKQYAEWISEELSCEALEYKEFSKLALSDGDLIIYGGRVHAGMIDGIKKIRDFAASKNCKLAVFATGASPAEGNSDIAQMWTNNQIDNALPHFYMQSGLCYEKMGFFDKTLMKMMAKIMGGKKDKTPAEAGMAEAISKSFDVSSKDNIKPLVEFVKTNY